MRLQVALQAVYPPQCISCGAGVTSDFGLCGECWRQTAFISGLVCDLCGVPVPGDGADDAAICDDCLTIARPWTRGRSAILYKDNGRRIVLALKHGDRLDLARPASVWMERVAKPLLRPDTLCVPVPLHWFRLFKRRYNQAAVLSAALAKLTHLENCPDGLIRTRSTGSQEGRSRDARFSGVREAFSVPDRQKERIRHRDILLIDDVMTSGATFGAATEALYHAGAASVSVLSLARVAKDA